MVSQRLRQTKAKHTDGPGVKPARCKSFFRYGAYADSKRDTAIENSKAAEARGDTQAAQGYWSEAQTLTTGTLTYSDIANSLNYSASSSGFSAGGSIGNSGKAMGPASVSGAGGVTPMLSQSESASQEATTRSAVSAGTITLTDGANQTQYLAGLSRDTTNTNGTVSKAPDVARC